MNPKYPYAPVDNPLRYATDENALMEPRLDDAKVSVLDRRVAQVGRKRNGDVTVPSRRK